MSTDPEKNETYVSHLVELRDRVLRSILVLFLCFLGLVSWAPDIYNIFADPLISALPPGVSMIATDVVAPFFVPIKVTFFVAFIISLPFILWQIWSFIEPALYSEEKKLALPVVLSSFLLFLAGMAFAYFVVFPAAFSFIIAFSPSEVEIATDIDKYFSFVMSLFLIFGLSFETPVVQMLLVRLDFVSLEKMIVFRPYFIVLAFVVAAIVTPPDVVSQLMLALPLCMLFELGIFLSKSIVHKSKKASS